MSDVKNEIEFNCYIFAINKKGGDQFNLYPCIFKSENDAINFYFEYLLRYNLNFDDYQLLYFGSLDLASAVFSSSKGAKLHGIPFACDKKLFEDLKDAYTDLKNQSDNFKNKLKR